MRNFIALATFGFMVSKEALNCDLKYEKTHSFTLAALGEAMDPSALLVGGLPRFLSETTFATTILLPSESNLGGLPLPLFAIVSDIIATSLY